MKKNGIYRNANQITLTPAELCVQCGVDHRLLSNQIRDGKVPVGEDGKISLRDYVGFLTGRGAKAKETIAISKAADLVLDLLERMKHLVDVEKVRVKYREKLVRVQQLLSKEKGVSKEQRDRILTVLADD